MTAFTKSGQQIFAPVDENGDARAVSNQEAQVWSTEVELGLREVINFASTAIQWKQPVAVATTANITLSGEQTIDGVLTSASRVLVKIQSAGSENGIYITAAGAWARADDANIATEVLGLAVFVTSGAANGGKQFVCTAIAPIVLGITALPFEILSDQSALNANLASAQGQINQLADLIPPGGAWPYPWAVTDASGTVLIGVNSETGLAEITTGDLPGIGMLDPDYSWAVRDADGKVLLGIRWDGAGVLGTAAMLDADYAHIETNEDGYVVKAQYWDGFVDHGSGIRGPSAVYTKGEEGSRDVYLFANGVEQRISFGGDNWAPQLSMGIVRYLSNQSGTTQFVSVSVADVLPFSSDVTSVYHVLGLGQSLSVGIKTTAMSTTALYSTKLAMFNAGILTLGNTQDTPFASMVLTDGNIASLVSAYSERQETPLMQLGVEFAKRGSASDGILVGAHGIGGQGILDLGSGSVPYTNLIKAATKAASVMASHGLTYIPAIDWIQGEHDNIQAVGWYEPKLVALQASLTTDINAATGHAGEVKLFGDQISSWTAYSRTFSGVPLDQLTAALNNPTKIKCVCPKYFLTHFSDGIHLTKESSARLGSYHGRAHAVERAGGTWLPLHIASAVRTGASVVLTYGGNDGNLTLDTTLVSDPGAKGFRWIDNGDGNTVTVSSVAVTGSNQVTLTLSATPTGTGKKVGYADVGIADNNAGPTTGPRGNVRDSSTDTDDYGNNMFNWACHQQIAAS